MKKPLLDVLFASEKRKNVLLFLQKEPQEMENILKSLGTTRQALLPQIRILEDHHLIYRSNDTYGLTTIGKLIVDDIVPLLDLIEVFNIDINYWGSHNLDFIPLYLSERLDEIKNCEVIKPSLIDLYEVNKDFIENSSKSNSLFFIFTFMHPSFPPHISQFVEKGIDTKIIITNELLEKLKAEWRDKTNEFIDSGKVKFYLFRENLKMVSLSVSDDCLALRLLNNDDRYDNTQIFCCNPKSRKWGKELFEYYLKDSTLIDKL